MPSTPPGQTVFRLRIRLEDINPTIWRRVLVPGSVRMSKLHDVFQAAMGWTNSHLHEFRVGDLLYGTHFEDHPEEEIDEHQVTVVKAIGDVRRFGYHYDFGDSWQHEVVIEEVSRHPLGLKFAVCLDGQNACPPEDSGGVYGYAEFLEVIADPDHEEHDHYLEWAGGSFDPAAFDLVTTNAALQRVR